MNNNAKMKNLSEEEGSVQNAIVNWWKTYDFFDKDIMTVYNDLITVIPQNKIKEQEIQSLLNAILKVNDLEKAAVILGNFVLRGDHQSQLHGFKEVSAKYRKSKR